MVLSYLLGLGDRHNGNIGTVKKNGMKYLCHIDFGYMLGTDPNLKGTFLTNLLGFVIQCPQDNFMRVSDKMMNEEAVNNNRELIVAELKRTYDLFYINLCFYKPPPKQQVDVVFFIFFIRFYFSYLYIYIVVLIFMTKTDFVSYILYLFIYFIEAMDEQILCAI